MAAAAAAGSGEGERRQQEKQQARQRAQQQPVAANAPKESKQQVQHVDGQRVSDDVEAAKKRKWGGEEHKSGRGVVDERAPSLRPGQLLTPALVPAPVPAAVLAALPIPQQPRRAAARGAPFEEEDAHAINRQHRRECKPPVQRMRRAAVQQHLRVQEKW